MPSIGGDRPLGSSVKYAAKFPSFSSGIPTIFTYSISLLAPPSPSCLAPWQVAKAGGQLVGRFVIYLRQTRSQFDSFAKENELLEVCTRPSSSSAATPRLQPPSSPLLSSPLLSSRLLFSSLLSSFLLLRVFLSSPPTRFPSPPFHLPSSIIGFDLPALIHILASLPRFSCPSPSTSTLTSFFASTQHSRHPP